MNRINPLVVNLSGVVSDMCLLATEYPTDRSPYSKTFHRHAYTAVYDLLFSSLRYSQVILGEFGILDNMSMHVWRYFFPYASLFGLDVFPDKIAKAKADLLPKTHYGFADISDRTSLFSALNDVGRAFDILIDDSTHLFDHQVNFVEVATDIVRPGGMVIIEDVFRGWDEARYAGALAHLFPFFSSATFIETNHVRSFSGDGSEPHCNNDKLLVLHRNEHVRVRRHAQALSNLSSIP